MILRPGGIDVFYIDESNDRNLFAVTAVAVPFIRNVDGVWNITWPDHLAAAKEWRRAIASDLKIPASKELHGTKLVGGRGNFIVGSRQIPKDEAAVVYREILSRIAFVPPESVITVVGSRGPEMYGHGRLLRVLHALFQRMRRQCEARRVNAMVFFDEGHNEYRELYRRAMVNLPTGSMFGGSRNLPLDMFVKDGNMKNSRHCVFTQVADLMSYAALSKIRHERKEMQEDQIANQLHTLYDAIPVGIRNLKASAGAADGIVRMT